LAAEFGARAVTLPKTPSAPMPSKRGDMLAETLPSQ
jgi:hypothetical protein